MRLKQRFILHQVFSDERSLGSGAAMFTTKQIRCTSKINSICNVIFNKTLSKRRTDMLTCSIHNRRLNESTYYDDVIKLKVGAETLKFSSVWLRENCQCERCFHRSAKSRIIDWSDFNLNVQPTRVQEVDRSVNIEWDDGHASSYAFDWLKHRSFLPEDQKRYTDNFYRPKKVPWHPERFDDVFGKYDYVDILESDRTFYGLLHNVAVYGVALIENTPDSDTAVDDIIDKIAFAKKTHYGEKYIVQQVIDTNNVAYLNSNLQMHTDLPYYEYCPGVNVLHCRVQTSSKGGENLLSDCHFVADFMRKHHPNEYKLLTSIDVEWSDVGVEDGNRFYKLHRCPVISLDRHGEMERFKLSIPQRGSHFVGRVEDVKPWYEAHGLFLELSHKFAATFRTHAGRMLVFDNSRLLHGRNAYEDTENNVRRVIGAFVDWDEIYSRLRCLNVEINGISLTN